VIKRNPDAKWKLSPEFIDEVKILQQKILTEYSVMVKKDGLIVYSTCSILPSENQEQVKKFLAASDKFEFIKEATILPSEGFDGFYNYANKMSPLGNATADQCAEYCISMFSDLTKMVTMQNLFHDGGFSFTGVDAEIIEAMGSK
jgi:16S rRNA C967 or C1407 C5-methylase (RsmB/RsmF family)